ncbi:hypothetical protein GCM10027214_25520 [Stenotrophomonas tumulicola]
MDHHTDTLVHLLDRDRWGQRRLIGSIDDGRAHGAGSAHARQQASYSHRRYDLGGAAQDRPHAVQSPAMGLDGPAYGRNQTCHWHGVGLRRLAQASVSSRGDRSAGMMAKAVQGLLIVRIRA